MSIISLSGLKKSYPLGSLEVHALKGINLEVIEKDFVSVAGPSGSGKTTMMNIIGLIDSPTDGKIFVQDREVGSLSRSELTKLRHETIGFVFQSFNLLPVLNVYENIELPLLLGRRHQSKQQIKEWVEHLLEEVGLENRMSHKPSELSGGQQQRVAIARALVTKPRIVIADEPTANLDTVTGDRILKLMKQVNKDEGTTFLFSTHDPSIWEMADHVIFLRDGMIESEKRR
jgi:putative ABC transport system ATP-binding protein